MLSHARTCTLPRWHAPALARLPTCARARARADVRPRKYREVTRDTRTRALPRATRVREHYRAHRVTCEHYRYRPNPTGTARPTARPSTKPAVKRARLTGTRLDRPPATVTIRPAGKRPYRRFSQVYGYSRYRPHARRGATTVCTPRGATRLANPAVTARPTVDGAYRRFSRVWVAPSW